MGTVRGSFEAASEVVNGKGLKPLAPGQGAAKMGRPRDVMAEDWAVRDHPHALYLKTYEDGSQRMARGRIVNPEKSLCTGGTVVKGRSKKGKFVHKSFVFTNAKSDSRMDPNATKPRFRQPEPVVFASRHEGTPVKTAKHVPLRSR